MILIDGKKIAAELREDLKKEVSNLKTKYNKVPGLTVILIGDLTPSQIYVRNKEKSAKEVGLKGIRVNAICPVLVKTDGLFKALGQKSAPGNNDSLNFIDQFKTSNSALNRLPEVDDIAEMVLFLASSSDIPCERIFTSSSIKFSGISLTLNFSI